MVYERAASQLPTLCLPCGKRSRQSPTHSVRESRSRGAATLKPVAWLQRRLMQQPGGRLNKPSNVVYDVLYDVVYDIVCNIVYDIVYDVLYNIVYFHDII
jgi:hypothetical protein